MAIDRTKFFGSVRTNVFHGHMKQSQVDGMNFILDEWEKIQAFDDLRWLSYMFGTAYHETAGTMMPIHEYGSDAYFTSMYDIHGRRPTVAIQMGNTNPGDGIKYCGRGYVQLTWKTNYERMGRILGIDLVGNPDLAMVPANAAKIMFEGMTRREILFENKSDANYTFSGKALEDYFNDSNEDWIGARHIINGSDHATLIAETAQLFYDAVDPD